MMLIRGLNKISSTLSAGPNLRRNGAKGIFGVKCLILLSSLISPLISNAAGVAIPVTPAKQAIQLKQEFEIYRDASGSQSFDFVSVQKFAPIAPSEDKSISLGYSKDTIWIRTQITNYSDISHWLLEIGYPLLDEIEVILAKENQTISKFITGDHFAFEQRPLAHRNFVFPLELGEKSQYQLYIRVRTDSSIRLPIKLWQPEVFYQKDQVRIIWQGIYFGILAVMLFYNLFLYVSIRETAFLYYVAYVGCYVVVQLSLNGLSYQYLWPEWTAFNDKAIVFGVSLVVFFGSVFSLNFLNLKQNLRWAWYLIGGIALLGLVDFILALWLPYSIVITPALLLTTIGSIAITGAGLVSWYLYRERIAILFTAAWSTFLVGSVVIALSRAHILPDNVFTDNAAQVGSALEVVLLSFALADKFSRLKKEKKHVQNQAKKSLKQVNLLLQDTLTRLEYANKIKNDFLSNISHELRTPLNGIVGGISLVDLDTADKKQNQEYVELAQQSAERMQELIESLLKFIDLQAGLSKIERNPIDWHQLEEDINNFLEVRRNNKTIAVILEVSEDIFELRYKSDHQKILSIIEILVDNAIKYTNAGKVTVKLTTYGNLDQPLNSGIAIAVQDTGIGIEPEQKAAIFEEFRQVDNSSTRQFGGLGLGLSVAKSLADMLKAEITVESTPGKGSCFSLKLDLEQQI